MVHILDDITGFQPGAVANKNNYIKCIARYLFENVNCSSNICKQQNRSGLGCYLIFPQCKTVRVGDVILK